MLAYGMMVVGAILVSGISRSLPSNAAAGGAMAAYKLKLLFKIESHCARPVTTQVHCGCGLHGAYVSPES